MSKIKFKLVPERGQEMWIFQYYKNLLRKERSNFNFGQCG